MSSATTLPSSYNDEPNDKWSSDPETNPLFPSEAFDLIMHLQNLLNTVKTPGALRLRHLLRNEPDLPEKHVRFLISIISPKDIPHLYHEVIGLPTPSMAGIIRDFLHTFDIPGKHFLAVACSESLLSILEERRDRLTQIKDEFERLVPWRADLVKNRDKMVENKEFEGKEKENWEREWRFYEVDLEGFVEFHNKLAAEARVLERCEKHLKRAETFALRGLGEVGETRSGRM